MRKETLIGIGAIIATYELSMFSFSRGVRRRAKEARYDITDKSILEVHHRDPRYRSNDDSESNAVALTRPEHAYEHMIMARRSSNADDKEANLWAVDEIKTRMTPQERKEFNRMIGRRH